MIATNEAYQAVVNYPFASVGIAIEEGRVKAIDYLTPVQREYRQQVPGVSRVIDAIQAYLQEPQSAFNLEPLLNGTPFQLRVWKKLQEIPCGKTMTYGELAEKIGSGARAVGNACRANPCPLIVPCHRVVATTGLGGFAGERGGEKLEIKRWLLRHEGVL
ncbi:MAG: methylated-DNA--[protein]-cysteine S-methyltransferase [Candidatus Thiodiazotropha sp.]